MTPKKALSEPTRDGGPSCELCYCYLTAHRDGRCLGCHHACEGSAVVTYYCATCHIDHKPRDCRSRPAGAWRGDPADDHD